MEGGEAAVVPKTKPNDAMFSIRGRHPGDGYAPVLRFAQNAFARWANAIEAIIPSFSGSIKGEAKIRTGRRAVSPKFGRLQYFSAPTIESERRIWYNGGDLPDKKGQSRVCPRA